MRRRRLMRMRGRGRIDGEEYIAKLNSRKARRDNEIKRLLSWSYFLFIFLCMFIVIVIVL